MEILTAVAFIAALSISLAILLAIAHNKLKVEEDPRIDWVEEMLPGANCGACGMPGCRQFAAKLVSGEKQPSECTVGGQDSARFIAGFLGVEAGDMEKRVARLLCAGGRDVAIQVAEYEGFSSCRAAAAVTGGFKGCYYGCLGLGDCQVACTFDAISMSSTGLPVVDMEKCTACGDCVKACPKGLFDIRPVSHNLVVQCKSILEGDSAIALCRVACTGCGICAADAPEGLITMKNNLPVLNEDFMKLQTDIATLRCPTGAIKWIEGQQFQGLFDVMNQPTTEETLDGSI